MVPRGQIQGGKGGLLGLTAEARHAYSWEACRAHTDNALCGAVSSHNRPYRTVCPQLHKTLAILRLYRALAEQLRSVAVELVGCLEKLELPPAEEGAAAGGAGGAGASAGGAPPEGGDGKQGGGGGVDDAPLGPGVGTGGTIPAAISDVLAPRGVPCSVNDSSPLQVRHLKRPCCVAGPSFVMTSMLYTSA